MPQLDPTWFASQLFWLVVTFLALYTILSRLVLPPLLEVMARRASTVEGDISTAQSLKSQAEQARLDYERAFAEARGKAQALINDTMSIYKAKAEVSAKDMDKQIETKLAQASKDIIAQKQEMISNLTPAVGELTNLIVEKLLQASPGSEQVEKAVAGAQKGRR